MPSVLPTATTLASSSSERSQLPNFLVRYSLRLIPSFGIVGLSWKGSQRTCHRPRQERRRPSPAAACRCSTRGRSRRRSRQLCKNHDQPPNRQEGSPVFGSEHEGPNNAPRCRHENRRQRSSSSIRVPLVGQGRPRRTSQRPGHLRPHAAHSLSRTPTPMPTNGWHWSPRSPSSKAGRFIWAIRTADDALIGGCGFDGFQVGKSHRAEVGYWLAKPFWGRGIMTAVVQRVCQHAFEEFGLVKITAHVFTPQPGVGPCPGEVRLPAGGLPAEALPQGRPVH